MLERDTWEHWLDPEVTDQEQLEPLLRPTTEATFVHYPVGREVGNVRNDGPKLVEE